MGFAAGFQAGGSVISGAINSAVNFANALENKKRNELEATRIKNAETRAEEDAFANKLESSTTKINNIDMMLSNPKLPTQQKSKLMDIRNGIIKEFKSYAGDDSLTLSTNMEKAYDGFNQAYVETSDEDKPVNIELDENVFQVSKAVAEEYKTSPSIFSVDDSNNLMRTPTIDAEGNVIEDPRKELVQGSVLMKQKKVLSGEAQTMKDFREAKANGYEGSYAKYKAEQSYIAKPAKKEYDLMYDPEAEQWVNIPKGQTIPKGFQSKDQVKESYKQQNSHLDKAFQEIAADRFVRGKEEMESDLAEGFEELGLKQWATKVDLTDNQINEFKKIEANIAKDPELYKRYSKMTEGQKIELIARRTYKIAEKAGDSAVSNYLRNLWPWAKEIRLRDMTPAERKAENKRRLLESQNK